MKKALIEGLGFMGRGFLDGSMSFAACKALGNSMEPYLHRNAGTALAESALFYAAMTVPNRRLADTEPRQESAYHNQVTPSSLNKWTYRSGLILGALTAHKLEQKLPGAMQTGLGAVAAIAMYGKHRLSNFLERIDKISHYKRTPLKTSVPNYLRSILRIPRTQTQTYFN